MKNFRIGTYIFCALFFLTSIAGAALPLYQSGAMPNLEFVDAIDSLQDSTKVPVKIDTISIDSIRNDTLLSKDSLQLKLPFDSTMTDSIATDSTKHKKVQALDATVEYSAKDSILFTEGNWAYLYGDANVKYKEMSLTGQYLTTNMDSSLVWGKFGVDSTGSEYGFPVFTQGDTKYEAKTIKYNYKTSKGFIRHVVTDQDEGHIIADKAKRNTDGSFFVKDAKYTTCDCEHFYMHLTRAKIRPGKDVVTGPAYMVVEQVPLPIAVPFAFFPFTSKYSSGIIFPSYADELDRGFGLIDGGYYFAINDYVDLALTGELYTKGSWGITAQSKYKRRYKYSGSFNLNYLVTKTGDKEVPSSYSVSKDFSIKWSHSQDSKANAYRSLSASVNYQTSSYSHNNLNSILSSDYTNNVKSSSVSLSQTFPNSKWSLSASMQITQRSSDSTVSVTLPNLSVSMSRIYPFKRKHVVGAERWYEKIYLSYSGSFSNSISTREDTLFKSNLLRDWANGAKHSIPIGATFTLFDHINITPSISYSEQWHTHKSYKRYDSEAEELVAIDTTYGFFRTYNYSTSLSFQTKLYGMYTPLFGGNFIKKIRHVFTPSISFSYAPDFGDPKFGFYKTYQYLDDGELETGQYSPYSGNVYSPPSAGKTGSISFSFQNNLEMKVRSDKDSSGTKIISLIDNFTASTSYNMLATSFRWSNISTSTRLKLSKSLTVNLSAVFDPYTYALNDAGTKLKRVNKLRVDKTGAIGRLMSTGYSFSESFNQDTFNKWFGKDDDSKTKDGKKDGKGAGGNKPGENDKGDGIPSDSTSTQGQKDNGSLLSKKKEKLDYDENGYLRNNVKWNLSANYSFRVAYNTSSFNKKTCEYNYKLTQTLGFSGKIQPTKNWSFSFSSSYDFDDKKFSYVQCNLVRDLDCFSLTASFIPIGPTKTYYVVLRVKSSILQDLKYQQRNTSSSYDPEWP